MSKRNPLRFKTEAEFIQEYGLDWRNNVPYYWGKQMDYLLGQDIVKSRIDKSMDYKYSLDDYAFSYKDINNGWPWSISKQMITRKRLPVILADGTIAKVGMKIRHIIWLENQVYHTGIIQRLYPLKIICTCTFCKNNYYITEMSLDPSRVTKNIK